MALQRNASGRVKMPSRRKFEYVRGEDRRAFIADMDEYASLIIRKMIVDMGAHLSGFEAAAILIRAVEGRIDLSAAEIKARAEAVTERCK